MESFFARYKNPLVLALVLLAQFVLLAVQVRPQLPGAAVADQAGVRALRVGVASLVTPPEKVLHHGGLGVRSFWSTYINLVDTKQQNQQLQVENQRLQLEEASLAEDAREGERLQEMLAFKQHYIDSTVPAQVVGSSGSDHGRLLYLDKGSNAGLAPDMPVITPDGIVGRIRSVDPNTSQVLEINDPTSAAGVLLEQTRTRGIVRGDGVGHTEIVNLMPDSRIKPGQTVLTSGGDQIFPRGLPVGQVERVVPDVDNAPLVDVILKPAANLGRLEEVLVVTNTSPTPTAASRRDLARSEGAAAAMKAAAAAKAASAEEAALEAERASDILAQRLPSADNVTDVDAPDALPGSSPATANEAGAPLHPPSALHSDQFSPGAMPAAEEMTPGKRYGAVAEGVPATDRVNKTTGAPDGSTLPGPAESAAFLAAHNAALAARPHAPAPKAAAPPHAATAAEPEHAAAGGGAVAHHANTAAGATAVGTSGAKTAVQHGPAARAATAPRPGAPSATQRSAGTATHPVHRAVPTQVITDGPLPAGRPPGAAPAPRPAGATRTSPPATRTPPPASRNRGPALVPDDGSRPPAASQQGPQ